MSYRTVKRVLGESNLARKCLWLFAACMLLLVAGSFWWYGSETDKIVYELNRFVGKALVNSAMLDAHKDVFTTRAGEMAVVDPDDQRANVALADVIRSRDFQWEFLHAVNSGGMKRPTEQFEYNWMLKLQEIGQTLTSDEAIDEALAQATQSPNSELFLERSRGNPTRYVYYQPVFAKQRCIGCHDKPGVDPYRADWKVGDLMAIVRVEFDTKDARDLQQANRSLLVTLGVVTVCLAVAAMYVVIRYIIVKPLAHLRDVSDAVRRGDVEQRAVIHTGDEFEELGAAFNRMLRQLLRQQDELRAVNGELDSKIDELAQLNMRLFEMNKVKSDFLATVSHELRTPLNSILGFSDLLSSAKALDEKQKRYAGNIERSGRQLLDMINDMLDLAKIETGRMEIRPSEFDVGAVVLTQCDLFRPLSEKKHIELDCEIVADLPVMFQDRGKIEQILNNLLSNAVKFTPDGGRIHVACRQDRRGDLRLVVADTGVGISESEQQAVFEKFRQGAASLAGGDTLKREYSGSGLGLSIVRELARLLGGDVTLESEVGRGSEFTVILPWSVVEASDGEGSLGQDLRQLAAASRPADAGGDI
ncbi:MAG TPA: ATP-binding protein [Lacipirellulaceae bacterium]|nr:ATP-binding protein [Lacipirellulaceae bacterium]